VQLIIEPSDGVAPLLAAIKKAKKSIEIAVFRFDRKDIETALVAAAERGVKVTALIAFVNRGGERNLRKLEMRFLAAGIIVARTADDLIRYHDKYLVIDGRQLFMLSFNFTHLDIDHSRGFGIVTTHGPWVREAHALFEADCTRSKYTAKSETFLVSPVNSRKELAKFLKGAKTELLIYDPKVSDREMLGILQERAKSGVSIKVLGKVVGNAPFEVQKLGGVRLHTRTIVRDRDEAFIGSQSLRGAELDLRRELGLIIKDGKAVKQLIETFEADWERSGDKKQLTPSQDKERPQEQEVVDGQPEMISEQAAEIVVQVFTEELDPLTIGVKKAVRKAVSKVGEDVLRDKDVKETMKKVVKKAMKEAVKEAVHEAQIG